MDTSDPRRAVEAAYSAWDSAFNSGDAHRLAAAYLSEARFLPPTHAVLTGPGEIEGFFAKLIADGVSDHSLRLIEADGDGKLVYAAAHWQAKAKGADGTTQSVGGIATHVFERQPDGSLKLRLHTFN